MSSYFNDPDHPNPLPDRDQTHTAVLLLIRAIKRAYFYHFKVLINTFNTSAQTAAHGAPCADPFLYRRGARRAGADVWFEPKPGNFRTTD